MRRVSAGCFNVEYLFAKFYWRDKSEVGICKAMYCRCWRVENSFHGFVSRADEVLFQMN